MDSCKLEFRECEKFTPENYDKKSEEFWKKNSADIIEQFNKNTKSNIINLSEHNKKEEPLVIRMTNSNNESCWFSNRYIGYYSFEFVKLSDKRRKREIFISIKPRFGDENLLKMLDRIFNIRLPEQTKTHKTNEETWIKTIIGIIWLRQLAQANRYGLPKTNQIKSYKGFEIKGKINIRESIKPFILMQRVVSQYYIKRFDETIVQILNQGYGILSKYFIIRPPDSATDIINHIKSLELTERYIPKYEYKRIRYKSIYISYKNVVDLSWRIINNKSAFYDSNLGAEKGFGLFIDMAEVWELYLEKILKRNFTDWKIEPQKKYGIYNNLFYSTSLRPDIVMRKDSKIAVFDAKWKRMHLKDDDVDRNDLFQINSYISYLLNQKENVVAGGLLYPLSGENAKNIPERQAAFLSIAHSRNWLGTDKTKFIIDGMYFSKDKNDDFEMRENEFIERLKLALR